jgi:diacylglycerol kinase family enzyme
MTHAIPVAVVLNAGSGTALDEAGVERLRAAFAAAGHEARIVRAAGQDLRSVVQRAADERPHAVVVGGGDGTLSTAAGVLAGTGVALGVLPLGTLNHFARDAGIPFDAEEAVEAVVRGRRVELDVGEVNGRVFINNSSLGLYPSIVRRREQLREELPLRRGKMWALAWATLTALRRAPFLDIDLCLDGRTRRLRTPFVFVGNNEYTMEGLSAGLRAGLEDGHLSIYTTTRRGRGGLVALAFRALFGRLTQARDFESSLVQTLDVRSRHKRLLVAADGEIEAMETPLRYRIRPRALTVMLPQRAAQRDAA